VSLLAWFLQIMASLLTALLQTRAPDRRTGVQCCTASGRGSNRM